MPEGFNKVIVIGDACVDIHIRLEDLLSNSAKEMPYRMSLGGTSGGTIASLSRLGVDTAFLGTIGKDFGGRFIREKMEELGVDTGMLIEKEELNTINVLAFIDNEGERHLWGFPRVDQAYADLDLSRIDMDKIRSASWLHSSGMTMLTNGTMRENLPEVFRIAYEAGVETSFDLNTRVSDLNLLDPISVEAIRKTIPYVKYLTGSAKDEFVSFYPQDNWLDSLRHFADEDHKVIARMGKEGFIVINNGEERRCPSYDVEVKNTTGAGDCFSAAFIAATLEGKEIFEAAKYANAVSGYKISCGKQTYDFDRETIEEFIKNTALRNTVE
ncbi:MAG: carbohydrate kinase family protein [Erysipelotrichaceae bacterium]|nr:carbohydrate kinase family protein [Erysipelotrichaceae bacterium]